MAAWRREGPPEKARVPRKLKGLMNMPELDPRFHQRRGTANLESAFGLRSAGVWGAGGGSRALLRRRSAPAMRTKPRRHPRGTPDLHHLGWVGRLARGAQQARRELGVDPGRGVGDERVGEGASYGLRELRALLENRRAMDLERFAHLRRELGLDAGGADAG